MGKRPFPVIAIPTTAGTGSEVTKVTVIGDHTGFKMGVLHPFVFTRTAIIDGALTLSLPPKLTAATGMDALVHAIEAYTGKRATPMTDVLALGSNTFHRNLASGSDQQWRQPAGPSSDERSCCNGRHCIRSIGSWIGARHRGTPDGHLSSAPRPGHRRSVTGYPFLQCSGYPRRSLEALREALKLPSDAKPAG